MTRDDKLFFQFLMCASGWGKYLPPINHAVGHVDIVVEIQSEDSKQYYIKRAEEKRRRKALKAKGLEEQIKGGK